MHLIIDKSDPEFIAILEEIKREAADDRAKAESGTGCSSWRDYHDDEDYLEERARNRYEYNYINKQWWGKEYYEILERLAKAERDLRECKRQQAAAAAATSRVPSGKE